MPTKESTARQGVSDAWDFWLDQHPVSVPEIIEEAVRKSFTAWLDDHEDEIKALIVDRAFRRGDFEKPPESP